MNETCNDSVFGVMEYKHRWFKKQNIILFGRKWNIIISAMAYSGKPITESERNAYKIFMEHERDNYYTITEKLKLYINNNLQEISENWTDAKIIERASELSNVVTPRSLVFMQDGATIMMLDCIWDSEHGIAVKLFPSIEIGPPECFI